MKEIEPLDRKRQYELQQAYNLAYLFRAYELSLSLPNDCSDELRMAFIMKQTRGQAQPDRVREVIAFFKSPIEC